jgi:E3 ubiquitin-protein ligase listerin
MWWLSPSGLSNRGHRCGHHSKQGIATSSPSHTGLTFLKILFSSSFSGVDDFFTAFWEALDSRALSSLKREATAAAFTASLLESMAFVVRRLVTLPLAGDEPLSEGDIASKASGIVDAQIRKTWQEAVDGNLKVPDSYLAKAFNKALAYLQRVKSGKFS